MGIENVGSPAKFRQPIMSTLGVAGLTVGLGGAAGATTAASTAVTGATETRTVFSQSVSIPAEALQVGTVLKVTAAVFYTATTGAETHTLAVALGSTDVLTTGNIDPADNGTTVIEATIVVRSIGSSGTVVGWGFAHTGTRGGSPASQSLFSGTTSTSTQAVDTTGALVVGIAIDRQGTATDSDSCRLDGLVVEILPPVTAI